MAERFSQALLRARRAAGKARLDSLTLLIALAALLGVAFVLALEATYGVAIYGDFIYQLSVGRNLVAGQGFYDLGGAPLASWPPLYSILLGLASLGPFDVVDVAAALSLAAFGTTVFVVGSYLRRRLESRFVVIWATFGVALSMPLADVASRTLTEPLFILLTTLGLISADKALGEGEGAKSTALVWTAVLVALAWLTRYIGVVSFGLMGLLLLFQSGVAWRPKVKRVALFATVAGMPMCLWVLHGFLVADGRVFGAVPLQPQSAAVLLADGARALSAYANFDLPWVEWPDLLALDIAAALATVAMLTVGVRYRLRATSAFDWRPCRLFGLYALLYAATLVLGGLVGRVHSEGDWFSTGFHKRYWLPLYLPSLVVGAFVADWLLGSLRGASVDARVRRLLAGALTSALALWIVGQVPSGVAAIERENSPTGADRSLSDPRWVRSETLQYVRDNPMDSVVLANQPDVIYLHNAEAKGYRHLRQGYGNRFRAPGEPTGRIVYPEERSISHLAPGSYVVLFRDWDDHLYPFGEPQAHITPGLEPVATMADGAIFKVNRNYSRPPTPHEVAYRRIVAGDYGEPAASGFFDVYLPEPEGEMVIYFKQPCLLDDIRPRSFFLQATRTGTRTIEGWSFLFATVGVVLNGDVCVALAPPTMGAFERMRTGQFLNGEIWSVEINLAALRRGESNRGG